jgi:5-methylthioadenosine/S-adenosylhomocysteine deaminase
LSEPRAADLLVTDGDRLTIDAERRIILDGAVAVAAGRIVAVGPTDEVRAAHPGVTELDASGCVVTPGFVNTHQHTTGDPLARSCVPDDLQPGESIFSWAVPLNDAHTPDDDGLAATLTFVDSLLNGVTTVIEAGTIGVWGWDIEHGPFAAPTTETLARHRSARMPSRTARSPSRTNPASASSSPRRPSVPTRTARPASASPGPAAGCPTASSVTADHHDWRSR